MDLIDIYIKKLEIYWDYVKQSNDIHCRLYLEFFVLYLTIGITFSIAIITQNMNIIFWIVPIIFLIFAIYYIIKIRSLPDELSESWLEINDALESLINDNNINNSRNNE